MSMNDELAKALNKSFGRTGRRQIEEKIKQGKIEHTTGTDSHTGNDIHLLRPKSSDLPDGRKIINGKIAGWNIMEIAKHVYNHETCEIYWRNEHPSIKRAHLIHPSNKWITLPDQYWTPHFDKQFTKSGSIKITEKYGSLK